MKLKLILVTLVWLAPLLALAQQQDKSAIYVGAMGGFATLSGDGSAVVTPSSASTSLFDPKNGVAGEIFSGIHFFKYVSFQADYVWNRNNAVLVSSSGNSAEPDFFRVPESITQHAFLGSVLVYFRKRGSRIRPYLSVGTGALFIHTRLSGGATVGGTPVLPPPNSHHASIALRTLVGIDGRIRGRWHFRYTFSETITRNVLGRQVAPALRRVPKNFQNLFGFYCQF